MRTTALCRSTLVLLSLLVVLPDPVFASGPKNKKQKPNIVLIVVDDLGYGELGCQGNPQIPTPHIDALAKNGIRCTSGYVSAPFCCPSRAGFMTGRYQTRFGHEFNVIGDQNLLPHIGLPLSEITLAELLRQAGYTTGLIGKWHLGGAAKYHPQQRGFDEFFGFLHEGHFYVPPPYQKVISHLRPKEPPYDKDNPLLHGTKPVVEPEYLTDAFTREAVKFIDKHHQKPFFLCLPYNAIHSPMQVPPKYLNRFPNIKDKQRQVFAGMLSALDDGVGAVLAKLQALNIEEDTLIIFLSDNGGPTAELTSSNLPLRGGKGQLWEGGVRVPFLIQWKGTLPAGKLFDLPVISLDILPTAVQAAGGKLPKDRPVDGVNLLPHLKGENKKSPHQVLFWRHGQNFALRKGDWKLVQQQQPGKGPAEPQLFNLAKDLGETTDQAKQQPQVLAELQGDWQKLNAQMVEPLWGGKKK